ncbi:fibronectin type III domain-containing protein [bacterium]|jgi:hypothetical protein|nr:fibronectin type III domain-containing protein [bacterium]
MKLLAKVFLSSMIAILGFANAAFALSSVNNLELLSSGTNFAVVRFEPVAGASDYTILMGTEPVSKVGDAYNLPPIKISNNTEYRISNLLENKTYYLRVFASSAQETSQYLSNELTVSTAVDKDLFVAPQIQDIQVLNTRQLQLDFVNKMDFNLELQPLFSLHRMLDDSAHILKSIVIKDEQTLTVNLTADLERNSAYELRIVPKLFDEDGNQISKNQIIAQFNVETTVSDFADLDSLEPLKILSAIAFDSSAFEVTFSSEVLQGQDLVDKIIISETHDSTALLEIEEVLYNEFDKNKILILTQKILDKDYQIEFLEIQSALGLSILPENSTVQVGSVPIKVEQTPAAGLAPVNVSGLTTRFVGEDTTTHLELKFDKDSQNTAEKFEVLVKTSEGKDFDLVETLGKELNSILLDIAKLPKLEANKELELKVISVDKDGNKSAGSITRLLIPETGPASLFATVLGSLAIGGLLIRRRRK